MDVSEKQVEAHDSFLTAKVGAMHRTSRTTHSGTVRAVHMSGCPVTRWTTWETHDVRDNLKEAADQTVDVSVVEIKPGEPRWPEDPEKIGAFSTASMHINLYLPPHTFTHFWNAADAANDSSRHIDIVLKSNERDPRSHVLSVTNAGLLESMPASTLHPVVAELRSVRDSFTALTKSILVWLYVFGAIWVAVTIFRWASS